MLKGDQEISDLVTQLRAMVDMHGLQSVSPEMLHDLRDLGFAAMKVESIRRNLAKLEQAHQDGTLKPVCLRFEDHRQTNPAGAIEATHTQAVAEEAYKAALREIEHYFDAEPGPGTPESQRFDELATAIEAYEAEHFPIDPPEPVEALKFRLDQYGADVSVHQESDMWLAQAVNMQLACARPSELAALAALVVAVEHHFGTLRGLSDVDAGRAVSSETVKAWVDSLTTENPLAVPTAKNLSHEELFGPLNVAEFTAQETVEYLEVSMSALRCLVASGKLIPTSNFEDNKMFSVTAIKSLKKTLKTTKL